MRARGWVCAYVCVCVRVRARARALVYVCVCVCVCVCARPWCPPKRILSVCVLDTREGERATLHIGARKDRTQKKRMSYHTKRARCTPRTEFITHTALARRRELSVTTPSVIAPVASR
jgi:hypothetical protein